MELDPEDGKTGYEIFPAYGRYFDIVADPIEPQIDLRRAAL